MAGNAGGHAVGIINNDRHSFVVIENVGHSERLAVATPSALKRKMIAILWCSYGRNHGRSPGRSCRCESKTVLHCSNLTHFTYFFKIQNRRHRVGISVTSSSTSPSTCPSSTRNVADSDADWWLKCCKFSIQASSLVASIRGRIMHNYADARCRRALKMSQRAPEIDILGSGRGWHLLFLQ